MDTDAAPVHIFPQSNRLDGIGQCRFDRGNILSYGSWKWSSRSIFPVRISIPVRGASPIVYSIIVKVKLAFSSVKWRPWIVIRYSFNPADPITLPSPCSFSIFVHIANVDRSSQIIRPGGIKIPAWKKNSKVGIKICKLLSV